MLHIKVENDSFFESAAKLDIFLHSFKFLNVHGVIHCITL